MAKPIQTDLQLCLACGAKCCRYVTAKIDTPRTQKDYDKIRWYLLHKQIRISVDRNREWYLEFVTPCMNLLPNQHCKDYENRPQLCRDYGQTQGGCESQSVDYTEYFKSVADFELWLKCQGVGGNRRR
jgi:Fe-S-cluster containining protein